jgi:hypothetical protein
MEIGDGFIEFLATAQQSPGGDFDDCNVQYSSAIQKGHRIDLSTDKIAMQRSARGGGEGEVDLSGVTQPL